MSYDIDPEKRAELLESSALGGNEEINGLTLRPVTSATWSLLARLKNGFVTGQKDGDYAFAVYSFVYLHSQPLAKIRAKVFATDQIVFDIYDFMDARPVEQMFDYVPWITRQIESVAATVTKSSPSSGGTPTDPKH